MGLTSSSPPDDKPPVGSTVTFAGETYTVYGYTDAGMPVLGSVTPLEGDDDGYEVGTSAAHKARDMRLQAWRLRARRGSAAERAWANTYAKRLACRADELAATRVPQPRVRARSRGAGRPRAHASRSSVRSGDSGDSSDGPEPAPARLCAAPWCDHPVVGPAKKRYCGTDRCNRARAQERVRKHRADLVDDVAIADRERLNDARVAGYVGDEAFGTDGEHALGFLFPESWEYDALQQRSCRCNGHHIDGGVVGCFKCGLSREAVVA